MDKNVERNTHENNQSKHTKPFSSQLITEKIFHDIVRELSSNKPLGPGTVPAWAIKENQTKMVPHLTYILNECIKNIIPDCI